MTNSYLIWVKNETPIVINYSTGNYFKSLSYIPASSILGAFKSRFIGNWGGDKENIDVKLVLSDAYPSDEKQSTLNPPGLITLYKKDEKDNYYVDGLREIIETFEGKTKWGEKIIRLKKGPENWRFDNGKAYPISISMVELNILRLDERTRTPYKEIKEEELQGYMAHVEAISQNQTFSFFASGDNVNDLIESLKEGLYVGSFKTKGYGLIKLRSFKEFEFTTDHGEYTILDFYGNVSYDDYERIKKLAENCILYENIGVEKRKRLDYNQWVIDYVIKSGSIIVLKKCDNESLYKEILNINYSSNGGKIVINHPIHGL